MEFKLDIILLGKRLRACRNAQHKTMKEFSELCGISERYLANLERGQRAPKLETLVRIANVAGVSTDYLLCDSLGAERNETPSIQDSIQTFTPAQQTIICDFIRNLADSLK